MQAWGEDCLSNQLPGNAGLGTDLALQRFRPNSLWLQASPSSPVGQAALSLPVNLPHLPELPVLLRALLTDATELVLSELVTDPVSEAQRI